MTLEDLVNLTTASALKAHVLIEDTFTKQIKSVSIRVDDDGTTSIILHVEHTSKRITSEDVRERNEIIESVRALKKKHPDIAGDLTRLGDMYVSQCELWEFLASRGVEVKDDDTIWESMERFFGEGKQADG